MGRRDPLCGAWLCALAFAALASALGCSRESSAPVDVPVDAPADASVEFPAGAYPLELDWFGARVRVERQPRRVVPANASAVDFVVALLAPSRVAALPEQALEYASLPSADGAAEADWSALPKFYAFTAETLLEYEPDLVLADPWQAPDTVARLEEAGVLVVTLPAVADWQGARGVLVSLAELLQSDASALLADLDARVEQLANSAQTRKDVRALCYSNFGSAGWTAGVRTTLHAQMQLAGIVNVVAEEGGAGHLSITFEELLAYDPGCILVSAPLRAPSGHAGDRGGASEALLKSEPALAGLRAVREGRIVSLPAWFYAAGSHRMVDGAETLARAIDELRARESAEPGAGPSR